MATSISRIHFHTPGFLPGKFPWTEEPGGLYSPWGHEELDTTEYTQASAWILNLR